MCICHNASRFTKSEFGWYELQVKLLASALPVTHLELGHERIPYTDSPYTDCISIHESRTLVFVIIITERFSILHKFVNNI